MQTETGHFKRDDIYGGCSVRTFWKIWQQRLERLATGRKGLGGIGIASFLETTIIPVPIEVLIAPVMAASRQRGLMVASVTLIGSIAGAVFLYFLAFGLFDELARPLIDLVGGGDVFHEVEQKFQAGGFWVVFAISITPVPMQLAALAAGATAYPFWLFLIAISISRALRYYGLWVLVLGFGAGVARIFTGESSKGGSCSIKKDD
ncbi:YqaA family protein [Thalassospira alkalitolerans]|uniref:YqaA family protein n=1 Tax=Thalassospira alkalitolerans TaxID=1293890 RepID=UPI000A1FE5CE|nr:VTT domain-containing protein [Thalassospira alkalitolerans]|tara:strand:+ start:16835 stop:17449 length:615 start_codon:yes stop_codon:yes gene_type:complete